MGKVRWLVATGVMFVLVAAVFIGVTVLPRLMPTATVQLEPFADIEQPPYLMSWKDITGAPYPQAFIDSFSYDDASVTITYRRRDPSYFTGTLQAIGLKPDFCYQIKLSGKPTAYCGADGDDQANEKLGYVGRWWREEPNPNNANDADYEAHKGDPDYVYSSYLLFGFFVTDGNGAASVEFASDSAYHVVWKTSQREPKANDGPVSHYHVGGAEVGLYAEWEPTRALPGQAVLPPGHYNLQFRLTEESFHDTAAFWAQVLKADDVRFEIFGEPETARRRQRGVSAQMIHERPS